MRAVLIEKTGGPEVLTLAERPDPEPGPGELLVHVAVSGVNYIDTYFRTGAYALDLPAVLGLEGSGTVRAVGSEVTGFAPGDRVAWPQSPHSYAEQVVVPADRVVPVPEGVDDEAAATLLQGMTAHYLLHDTYPVRSGDTILVHAAAGGMGLLLTQWATSMGARVIGTVSTEEKERLAREAGAAEVVRYTEQDFVAEVKRLTDGEGVAAVYDGVGATTFDGSLASVRRRGMLIVFGASSGPVPPFDVQRLNQAGGVFLTRPSLAHYIVTHEELAARGAAVFDAMRAGELTARIGGRYPLADAARAHTDLESRRTTGKLVLLAR
jgi:NADPH2:quinone reductase